MSPSRGRRAVADLDTELTMLIAALAFALVGAWMARDHLADVRRELRASHDAREGAQADAAKLRGERDGALDTLHKVALERDQARGDAPDPS